MSHFVRHAPPDPLPGSASSAGGSGCKYFLVGIGLAVLGIAVLAILGVVAYALLSGQLFAPSAQLPPVTPGPDVAFQEPTPGACLAVGESVLVFATARDANRVTRVDLWVDDQLAIQQTAPDPNGLTPFSLIHNLVATKAGTYSLRVRAYNALGALGESPVVNVTVIEQVSAQPIPVPTVLPPALPTPPVVPVPPAVPSPVAPSAPAEPPAPLAPPHPPLPPNPPVPPMDWLPGLAPDPGSGQARIMPGPLPGVVGVVIMPGLMPGRSLGDLLNPHNASLKAPELLTANVAGCTVTLTWKDTSEGKATFDILREGGGDLRRSLPKNLPERTQTYPDKVPNAGTYIYQVVAYARIGQDNYRAKSNLKQVTVPPAADCIPARTQSKLVYFKPDSFQPAGGVERGALRVTVGEVTRRIPSKDSLRRGDWSEWPAEVFPAPESLYGNVPSVQLEVNANGSDESGAPDLGGFGKGFPLSDLKQNHVWTNAGQRFSLGYHFWVEDMKWTGKGTTDKLTAPTNLRFGDMVASRRILKWDWTGDESLLDAYILYRAYSCPSGQGQIRAPQVLPKDDRYFIIWASNEPAGCVASYEVSAFGLPGESATSNRLMANTTTAIAAAQVTFKDLTVTQDATGDIWLVAGQQARTSEQKNVKANTPLLLDQVRFSEQNNIFTVNLAKDEALWLHFTAFDCQLASTVFRAPDGNWKNFSQGPKVIESKDTQRNVVCKMTVEIKMLDAVAPPVPVAPGGAVPCAGTPAITFVASPTTIDAGKTSTLSWSVANATKVEIDQGIGDVAALGSKGVNPQTTTTYTLTATGCDGKPVTKQAKVEVRSAAPPSQADAQLFEILAGANNYWGGEFWAGSPSVMHYASFCFRKDGRFDFYIDGKSDDKGKYRLVNVTGSGDTYFITFQVTNDSGTETYKGMLNVTKTPGREQYHFLMQNGPPEWKTIKYAPASVCQ